MQCLSQLITKEQTHLSKIWDTVQTCREENAILVIWSQDKYYFNFYEFLKLSRASDIVENNIAKISLFVMFIIFFFFWFPLFIFTFFYFWRPDNLLPVTHTRYLSPATPHPLPVTCHPLPFTRYPSPATRHPSPATRHPPPAEKSCRRSLLCADFPCARNGARLWKTSPQVLHTYSRWAARRSWTCFTCRFKAFIRLNFRPQREHSCRFPRTA